MLRLVAVHKEHRLGSTAFPVLHGVDLAAEAGEFIAVMGPSGSGKTTLLNLLAGLDRPDRGEVWVRETRIDRLNETQLALFRRQHVGIVFQAFHLIQGLTVAGNVELPALLNGTPGREVRARRAELLERLGLQPLAHKLPIHLSGGEQQRVAIARALINRPALLLADEPTGNLDRESGRRVLQLLRELHAEGQSIVMVTHDQEVADAAQRVIRMVDGRLAG